MTKELKVHMALHDKVCNPIKTVVIDRHDIFSKVHNAQCDEKLRKGSRGITWQTSYSNDRHDISVKVQGNVWHVKWSKGSHGITWQSSKSNKNCCYW